MTGQKKSAFSVLWLLNIQNININGGATFTLANVVFICIFECHIYLD